MIEEPATKVYGACPLNCPDTCGVVTEVKDNRAVKFYGDPDHPITRGWLCTKVRPYLDETVYHPGRIATPLRRVSKKTEAPTFVPITWDDALAEISERWKEIIATYGAEAILPYSFSGTLGQLQNYMSGARFFNRMGASQLERSICSAAAAAAIGYTLGRKLSMPHEDVIHSKLIIIWGANPISTGPHFMPFLNKAKKNGTQMVVIDPRRTRTAKQAHWHIAPKPGTDGALALAMAHVIFAEGLHDEAWLKQHCLGWEAFREHVADCTPEWAASECDIPAETITKLARMYAQTQPSVIKPADGLQRHSNGGQTTRTLLALPAITGQYGKLGGGMAYSTAGFYQWDNEQFNRWSECPKPGRWVNINRLGAALTGEIQDPPIKSLFVYDANPMASTPNTRLIKQGLEREDLFTVVHELFMTDTADMADIVLPATSQLEQLDLHRAYGHTVLRLNDQALPPFGQSRSNWDTYRSLAKAMGYTEQWLHDDTETVINELLAHSTTPGVSEMTVAKLREMRGSYMAPGSDERPWINCNFETPSGKVELFSQPMADAGHPPLPTYLPPKDVDEPAGDLKEALNLVSGASHYTISSTFGNSASLKKHSPEPFVEINPADAEARGITHGDRVKLFNIRGDVTVKAVVTDGVRTGVAVAPKGHWGKHHGGKNINTITPDAVGDLAGQSTFHTNLVWISKV